MDENFYLPPSHKEVKRVHEVQFEIMSAAKTMEYAVCQVTKPFTLIGDVRVVGGLSDLRMGSTDRDYPCVTCNMKHPECPGHFGYADLAEPMFNIGFFDTVLATLRCVCQNCGKLLLNNEKEAERRKLERTFLLKGNARLRELAKISPKGGKCPSCQFQQARLGRFATLYPGLVIKADKDKAWFGTDAYRILDKIATEDAIMLGFDPRRAHPRDLLIKVLPIPPPAVRPAVSFGSGVSENELTAKLVSIIRLNERLGKEITDNSPSDMIASTRRMLQADLATYFNNASTYYKPAKVSQTSKMTLKSIYERLKGKQGRLRGNLMGKRVNFSARTVITGDPNIDVDEVGVPFSIAMTLTFPERVNYLNRHRLQQIVRSSQYPSANAIVSNSGTVWRLNGMKPERRQQLTLEIGDIVERQVLNGDVVLFNRQPTLHRMSMMGHRVRVLNYNTFRLNLSCTTPYNADFDGDEMNLHVPQSLLTKAELIEMMMVPKNFVSPNKSSPCMGIVQDSLLGSYRLTDKEVFLDKYFVQNVFMWLSDLIPALTELPIPALLKPRPLWTGKQMFSLILREANITREAQGKVTFPHNDSGMLIRNGDVLVGQVEKKLVGAAAGSLIHVIFNDRGSDAVAQFINGVQRLTTQYLYHFSFSVGVQDTLGDEKTLAAVRDMIAKARVQVRNRGSAANEKTLTRRAGMTLMGSFEFEVNSILNTVREKASPMVKDGVHRRNSFRVMVDAGSKGSPLNIYQIVAAVGQQNIFGARIPFYFRRRTLPHFMLDDYGDASKGHVSRGYVEGLKPYEFFFHMMGGREGLIDTAVKTAETGYFQRKLVKAMEDLHVAYDGTVRNADQEVVQFTYGEDGLDGARIEDSEKINLYTIGNREMEKLFKFEYSDDGAFDSNLGGPNMAPAVQAALKRDPKNLDILDSEYKALLKARDDFRSWLRVPGTPALPVNITRVIRNAQIEGRRATELTRSNLNPINIIQDVRRLLKDLEMCHPCTGRGPTGNYLNPHSQERVQNALRIFSVHVQSLLASKRVINEHKLDSKSFEFVLKQIRLKYLQSVVTAGEMIGAMTAQSCGEPATQMTLNTFHNAGISSKNVTLGVPRLLELLSVSKNQRISSMSIHLVAPWNRARDSLPEADREARVVKCAQTASRYVEFTTLETIATKVQIIFDPDPDNSVVEDDRTVEALDQMVRANERKLEFGGNFSPWVVRITVPGDQMIARNLTSEDISVAIRAYGERQMQGRKPTAAAAAAAEEAGGSAPQNRYIVIVSVTDPTHDTIVRIRLSEDIGGDTVPQLKKEIPLMLATIALRGIPGVSKVFTGEAQTYAPDPITGAIPAEGEKSSILETEGTALLSVFSRLVDPDCNPICEWRRTASDNIPEIFRVLGVEAARQKLLLEIRNVYVGYGVSINYRHYSVLCDTMCHRGYLMAVSRVGVNRSNVGPLMRCSFEETVGILMRAAAFGERDNVRGVSANLILGNQAKIGTGLFDLMLDVKAMSRAIPQSEATRPDKEVNIYHGPSSLHMEASAIPVGDGATPLIHDASVVAGGAMQSAPFDSRLFASATASSDAFTNSASRTPTAAVEVQSIMYTPVIPEAMGLGGLPFTQKGAGGGLSSSGGPSSFSTASVASSHGMSIYDAYAGDNFALSSAIPGVAGGSAYGGSAAYPSALSDVSSFGLQSSAPYGSVHAPSLEHTDYLSNPYASMNPAVDTNNAYGLASSAASSSQRGTLDSVSSHVSSTAGSASHADTLSASGPTSRSSPTRRTATGGGSAQGGATTATHRSHATHSSHLTNSTMQQSHSAQHTDASANEFSNEENPEA